MRGSCQGDNLGRIITAYHRLSPPFIAYHRLQPLVTAHHPMKTPHLLIIRFSAMGDVAMTVPIVYSLARQYPDVRISVLSRPFAQPFFQDLAPNVCFMAADLKGEYKGLAGLNRLYRRLIAKQPTAVADLHNVLRTRYLRLRFLLGGYPVAHINKHKKGKRQLCRKENKVFAQQPTSFHNYADVLGQLGYPVKPDFKSIFPQEGGDLRNLPNIIGVKQPDECWIGIAPFAAHAGKMYPQEKMGKVISLLTKQHPSWRIFLFGGGRQEIEVLNGWAAEFPQCLCVANALKGLEQELILMSHLDTMLSMDSANMHLASLTGTRVVSVWGATHPYCGFMGWNQKAEDAVQITTLPCRPCSVFGNRPCHRGDFACMNNILPEEIVQSIEAGLLSGQKTMVL